MKVGQKMKVTHEISWNNVNYHKEKLAEGTFFALVREK